MTDKSRDFDALGAIKPAQDEVANYRRSGRSEAPRQSNFNGVLVFVIVLMAIMMGIGGYALWQVQQKLDQANQLLDKGQRATRDLENRLSQTGDTASKKFSEMDAQIKTNVAQIDKLWASAYRQNKADIGSNKDAINNLTQQISALNALTVKIKGDSSQYGADIAKLKQDVASDSEDASTQMSLVRGQVQDQSVVVEGNKRNLSILQKKVKDLQDAISVIDKYRQQVNQQILDLQSKVQGSPKPGP